jgi:hypothetical protein
MSVLVTTWPWPVQAAEDLATAKRLVDDGNHRRGWRRSARTSRL